MTYSRDSVSQARCENAGGRACFTSVCILAGHPNLLLIDTSLRRAPRSAMWAAPRTGPEYAGRGWRGRGTHRGVTHNFTAWDGTCTVPCITGRESLVDGWWIDCLLNKPAVAAREVGLQTTYAHQPVLAFRQTTRFFRFTCMLCRTSHCLAPNPGAYVPIHTSR